MAYSKPMFYPFLKQYDDLSTNLNLPSNMPTSPFPGCGGYSGLNHSPTSPNFPLFPPSSGLPSFPTLASSTKAFTCDHPSQKGCSGSGLSSSGDCKICRTLTGLDLAAFYWSLMAMYGFSYRGPPSPSRDSGKESPTGSIISSGDSQPPSPAGSTGEEGRKDPSLKYQCTVCSKSYSHPRLLNRHLQSHTPYKKHHCPRCGKGFNDAFDLKRHIRTHTGVKPFKCQKCDKAFTQRCSLEAHVTRVHGEAQQFSFRERRPKLHVCEECGECFNENSKYRQHLKEHTPSVLQGQLIQFN